MVKIKKLSSIVDSPDVKKFLAIFDNRNMTHLAAELQERKSLTPDEAARLLRVSKSTAFRYLNQFEDVGLVECSWEISRSSAPKANKVFSLTEDGKQLLEKLMDALSDNEN